MVFPGEVSTLSLHPTPSGSSPQAHTCPVSTCAELAEWLLLDLPLQLVRNWARFGGLPHEQVEGTIPGYHAYE